MRVGQGFDAHRLMADRPLWLGGVQVPWDRGLLGHSDGDALLHAVADALLGALGDGDLGAHFPPGDENLAGASSADLLRTVVARAAEQGFRVGNLDATVIAEEPRLAPHQQAMRLRVAELLGVPPDRVNIKIKSTDGLGAVGRGEGIAAQAVILLLEAAES